MSSNTLSRGFRGLALVLSMSLATPVFTGVAAAQEEKGNSAVQSCAKGAAGVAAGHIVFNLFALAADMLGCMGFCSAAAMSYSASAIVPDMTIGCTAGAVTSSESK